MRHSVSTRSPPLKSRAAAYTARSAAGQGVRGRVCVRCGGGLPLRCTRCRRAMLRFRYCFCWGGRQAAHQWHCDLSARLVDNCPHSGHLLRDRRRCFHCGQPTVLRRPAAGMGRREARGQGQRRAWLAERAREAALRPPGSHDKKRGRWGGRLLEQMGRQAALPHGGSAGPKRRPKVKGGRK